MSKLEKRQSKILDECLERILTGKGTVGEILRQFPSDARDLIPMLTLALEARDDLEPDYPKPGYVITSRRRILSRMSRRLQGSTRPRARAKPPAWRWQLAEVFIGLILAIGMLAISMGVVHAANAALPGDALYGLKRGIERARIVVTWSASGDMRLLAEFADTRLAELVALVAENRLGDLDLALDGFEEALSGLTGLAGEADADFDPGTLEYVLERLAHHQEVLGRVSEQVPDSAQAAIQRAMERSAHSQEVIQELHQGGRPSDVPPGQQRTPPGQELTPPGQERTPPGQQQTPPGQERKLTPTETPTPTPLPPTPAPTMHVEDIDAQVVGGPNNRQAWVTISVAQDSGAKVDGATVTGGWTVSGEGVEFSCVTNASGKCTIKSGIISGEEGTTFMVTDVTHASYPYAPEDNSDPDDDSDGTIIVIELPN